MKSVKLYFGLSLLLFFFIAFAQTENAFAQKKKSKASESIVGTWVHQGQFGEVELSIYSSGRFAMYLPNGDNISGRWSKSGSSINITFDNSADPDDAFGTNSASGYYEGGNTLAWQGATYRRKK